jgi:hypothetical protein
LLVLAGLGVVVGLRERRYLPLGLFAAAGLAQTALLAAMDTFLRNPTYYLTFKMVHLHLYWLAAFGAAGLFSLWRWSSVGRSSRPKLRSGAALVLVGLIGLIAWQVRPPRIPRSTVTEPVYQSGLWARANLPPDCLDYLVDHWATAYWLHVNVLGHSHNSKRAEAIVEGFRTREFARDRWSNPERLPYAIVDDLGEVPRGARAGMEVLFREGEAGVVRRADEARCG